MARGGWTPVSVKNVGPVLTPDWECHEMAWLNGWPPDAHPSIGERVLPSGVTAVVFTVRLPLLLPDLGINGTTERHHGYDRLTGREVLREVRHSGTINGAQFNMEMLMELELAESQSVSDVPLVQGHPGPTGSPGSSTSPVHGAPMVKLTYEGTVYYQTPLSTDEAANLNEDDLQLVGIATESNLLFPAGSDIRRFIVDLNRDSPELTDSEIKDRVEAEFQIGVDRSAVGKVLQGGLNIYKLNYGEEGYVYTFEPGQSMVNPEDGQIFSSPAVWIRWAAADSNGA